MNVRSHAARIVGACAVAVSLAACGGSDTTAHQERIAKLTEQLNAQEGERKAELAYWRNQGAVAAACDFIVPICPDSVADPGRDVLDRGFGVNGGTFWMLVSAKFFSLAALTAGLLVGGLRLSRLIASKSAVLAAEGRLEKATARLAELEVAEQKTSSALAAIRQEYQGIAQQLEQAKRDLEQTSEQLAMLEIENRE